MAKQNGEKCFNTFQHGSIWGIEIYPAELDGLAQRNGFLKSDLVYVGNIYTFDINKKYMFFRSDELNMNYFLAI